MNNSSIYNIASLDWGSVRFGLAFGNSETKIVIPFNQICLSKDILKITATELSQRKIYQLILGIPTNFNGQDTQVTNQIRKFSQSLQEYLPELTIKFFNERESTKQAKIKQGLYSKPDKHITNHLAAAEILNYYLGQESKNKDYWSSFNCIS